MKLRQNAFQSRAGTPGPKDAKEWNTMIEIALAGIYSFASEWLSRSILEDFLSKSKLFSSKVASIVENIDGLELFKADNS